MTITAPTPTRRDISADDGTAAHLETWTVTGVHADHGTVVLFDTEEGAVLAVDHHAAEGLLVLLDAAGPTTVLADGWQVWTGPTVDAVRAVEDAVDDRDRAQGLPPRHATRRIQEATEDPEYDRSGPFSVSARYDDIDPGPWAVLES